MIRGQHMDANEINEQNIQYAVNRVCEDSTRWDRMTGNELKRRIKALQKDEKSFTKVVDVVSCLRLAQLLYLRTKKKEENAIPLVSTVQGQVLFLFTAKSQIKHEDYKQYATETATYPSLIKSITTDIKAVIINPDTEFFSFAVQPLNEMISFFDGVEGELDAQMEKGFQANELSPLLFERFFGRRIDCITKSGTVIGDACQYDLESGRAYLEVDLDDGSTVKVFHDEVVSIKDITNETRP